MSQFVYEEDRDWETGHGWRYHSHTVGPDHGLDHEGNERMLCSYAWIGRKESWEATNYVAADELRTRDLEEVFPDFHGSDDMEGHFEFPDMNPEEMCSYLNDLGFIQLPPVEMPPTPSDPFPIGVWEMTFRYRNARGQEKIVYRMQYNAPVDLHISFREGYDPPWEASTEGQHGYGETAEQARDALVDVLVFVDMPIHAEAIRKMDLAEMPRTDVP